MDINISVVKAICNIIPFNLNRMGKLDLLQSRFSLDCEITIEAIINIKNDSQCSVAIEVVLNNAELVRNDVELHFICSLC